MTGFHLALIVLPAAIIALALVLAALDRRDELPGRS